MNLISIIGYFNGSTFENKLFCFNIKTISINKKDSEIILMFNEILEEIKKIDLRVKIESLEDKVSTNLDENLYSELLSLRNQLKRG